VGVARFGDDGTLMPSHASVRAHDARKRGHSGGHTNSEDEHQEARHEEHYDPQASFEESDGQMQWTEWLMCWFKPSHWRDDHPLTPEERAGANPVDGPDGYIDPQRGVGAESYDRVDVARDLRKP
jgi:hypothetical protein